MKPARTIRGRLRLLAAVYVVAILVNSVVSAALIVRYLQPALMQARQDAAVQQKIDRVRSLLRSQGVLIQDRGEREAIWDRYLAAQAEISSEAGALREVLKSGETADLWLEIERTTARKARLVDERFTRVDASQGFEIDATLMKDVLADLGQLWQQAGQNIVKRRTQSVAQATKMQRGVLVGLTISTATCLAICVAGTLLIRRWMVQPLAELKKATAHFARGNLSHQIPPLPKDEIGQLGHELSQMAGKIAELELRRLNQIRFEAASMNVRELDDLVRGPLGDIRALVGHALEEYASEPESVKSHRTMLETIDQLDHWLARLQESTSGAEPAFKTFDPTQVVTGIQAVMQASLKRHQVRIEAHVDPGLGEVEADRAQIEHALLSLVSNAVEASQPGQTVHVRAESTAEDVVRWDISVADEGPGIPPEVEDRIGRPFFTTKPEGSGFGLLIVNSVVKAHAGRLLIESREGVGARFTMRLPRRQC